MRIAFDLCINNTDNALIINKSARSVCNGVFAEIVVDFADSFTTRHYMSCTACKPCSLPSHRERVKIQCEPVSIRILGEGLFLSCITLSRRCKTRKLVNIYSLSHGESNFCKPCRNTTQ